MKNQQFISKYAAALVIAAVGAAGVSALAQTTQPTQPAQGSVSAQSVDSLFLQAATAGNAFEIETSKLALQKSNNAAIKAFAQRMIDDHTKAQQSVNNLLNQLQRANNTGATGGGSAPTTSGSSSSGNNASAASGNNPSTGSTSGTTGGSNSGSTGSTTGSSGTNTTGTGTNTTGGTGNTSSNASSSGTGSGTPTTSSGNSTATQGNQGSNPSNFSNAGTVALNSSLTPDQQIKVLALSRLSGAQFNAVYVREQINAHEATIQLFRYAASYATNAQVKAFATQTLPTLQRHYAEALRLPKQ